MHENIRFYFDELERVVANHTHNSVGLAMAVSCAINFTLKINPGTAVNQMVLPALPGESSKRRNTEWAIATTAVTLRALDCEIPKGVQHINVHGYVMEHVKDWIALIHKDRAINYHLLGSSLSALLYHYPTFLNMPTGQLAYTLINEIREHTEGDRLNDRLYDIIVDASTQM